jgi:hypothetical protein
MSRRRKSLTDEAIRIAYSTGPVYLNVYMPILQFSGHVVAFMTQYLGLPIPSPTLLEKIGQRFRRAVASFAEANDIL